MKPVSALRGAFRTLLLVVTSLIVARAALAQTAYEASLPAGIDTAPALCELVSCGEVLPGATFFSERKGQPRYVEGFAEIDGKRQLVGYVMLSTDITDTPAYSGKPVVTLIGMDTQGRFTGVKILKHSEPILLLGIPESALTGFNDQYLGKFVGSPDEDGFFGAGQTGEHRQGLIVAERRDYAQPNAGFRVPWLSAEPIDGEGDALERFGQAPFGAAHVFGQVIDKRLRSVGNADGREVGKLAKEVGDRAVGGFGLPGDHAIEGGSDVP